MGETENCCICLESKTNIEYLSRCKHSFCKKCIQTWRKDHVDCPVCRKIIFPEMSVCTRKNSNFKEQKDDLEFFLYLYFRKKLQIKEKDRDFEYYKELFQVFLLYPQIFFDSVKFREMIHEKVTNQKKRMVTWTIQEKKEMNRLMESVENVSNAFEN